MNCDVQECIRPGIARNLCKRHYGQWRKTGSPVGARRIKTTRERLSIYSERTGDCWLWTASRTHDGYGQVRHDGRMRPAHRVSYELARGPIPDGLHLDHLCRNRACINPAHLEPVTNRENQRRGGNSFNLTGLCRAGKHDMADPLNVYLRADGGRHCRACVAEKPRVRCLECGNDYSRTSLLRHRQTIHAAVIAKFPQEEK